MNWPRFLTFLRRRRFEESMKDEFRHHLELRQERNEANGMPENEARWAALRAFGGVEQIKEAAREVRPFRWVERLGYELGLVVRRLWRKRAQSALMLFTFGISLGISVLSWSLFHAIFLQNPEFDPDGSLVVADDNLPNTEFPVEATREEVEDWQAQQTVFTDTAIVALYNSAFLKTDDGMERMLSANLSTAALRMLGAKPLLGRLFTPDEDRRGCAPVVLLSESTWRTRFGADPRTVGRVLQVDGKPATVVGVLPDSFRFPNHQQIWLPVGFLTSLNSQDPERSFHLLARLKPGVSLAHAQDQMVMIQNRRPIPAKGVRFQAMVHPFRDYFLHSDMRFSAAILLALSLLFVLVSCSNAANLAMIDFLGRRVEIATSTALGIPRLALVRQVALQVGIIALLAAVGSVLVLLFAAPYVHAALRQMDAPYWLEFRLEGHHVAVAAGLALFSSLAAVVVPAGFLLLVTDEELVRAGTGGTRGSAASRWRRGFLIGQVAILTVLGISAAALVRSSLHLANRSLGFDAGPVYLAKLGTRETDLPRPEDRRAIYRRIAEDVSRLPGIVAASVVNAPPGYPLSANCFYAANPKDLGAPAGASPARNFVATEGFLSTLGIPLESGEDFIPTDRPGEPDYAIVNHSLAARLWPNGDAVGRALYVRFGPSAASPVVTFVVRGVTREFRPCGLMQPTEDAIYTSFHHSTGFFAFLVAKGRAGPPEAKAIYDQVKATDSRVTLYFPDTLQHQIDITLSAVRMTTRLTLLFAVAAGLLCAVGIYSVTVSQVMQQSREFGIRMALGIEAKRLWSRFTGSYLILTACGVTIGAACSLPVLRLAKALMFGVDPYAASGFLLVAGGILAVAALACLPCLFRLLRINPADCLRSL